MNNAMKHLQRTMPAAACALALILVGSVTSAADDHMMGGKSHMGHKPQDTTPPMESMEDPALDAMNNAIDAKATDSPLPTLPGFAGAPGLYHMGATGFFLDHPEHISLSPQQRESLEEIKAAAGKRQGNYRRRIEQLEAALWNLTGEEQPDAAAIDSSIRKIAALRIQQREIYIQAVGEAAKALTSAQRQQLAGLAAPEQK